MSRTAILTFMRCQPCPHKGHDMIFNAMRKEWLLDTTSSVYFVYLSKSKDKKNPISYNNKLDIAKRLEPLHSSRFVEDHPGTIIGILKQLETNYQNIIFYCGPDRVASFTSLIETYNGIKYNFDSIKVCSIGTRNELSTDVSGISGTKMREAITEQDFNAFYNGLPEKTKMQTATEVYRLISTEMRIPQRV